MINKVDLAKALEEVNINIPTSLEEDISIAEMLEDSLHLISLLVHLEIKFGIEFTDDELNGNILSSSNYLLETINQKLKKV